MVNGKRDFINVVIWRQQAENLANWAKKGALIGVTGRIQTRSYDNQQGQRVYVTEVVAESFQLLESRTARDGQGGGYSAGNSFAGGNDYNSPYQAPAQSTPNFAREEVHLEQTIQWIYQTMTYHSRSETNNIKENTHGSTTSWRFQTP